LAHATDPDLDLLAFQISRVIIARSGEVHLLLPHLTRQLTSADAAVFNGQGPCSM
jgi:hypothetical protein